MTIKKFVALLFTLDKSRIALSIATDVLKKFLIAPEVNKFEKEVCTLTIKIIFYAVGHVLEIATSFINLTTTTTGRVKCSLAIENKSLSINTASIHIETECKILL